MLKLIQLKSYKDDKDQIQTTQNNFDTSLTTPSYTDSKGISITEPTTEIYNDVIPEYAL